MCFKNNLRSFFDFIILFFLCPVKQNENTAILILSYADMNKSKMTDCKPLDDNLLINDIFPRTFL